MIRVNNILEHPKFQQYLNRNAEAEKDRVFCHHNIDHLIAVARIAYIMVLENNLNISKDIIYAAALLHDIGRWKEYKDGTDHAVASAKLALDILEECGFHQEEIQQILSAIKNHRRKENNSVLDAIIYRSDKMSRVCSNCSAIVQCKRFENGEKFKLDY